MSSDGKDKPFAPTQHKLNEARKRGEVPHANDAPLVASLLCVCAALLALSGWMISAGRHLLESLIELAFSPRLGPAHLAAAARLAAQETLLASLALLFTAGVAATLVKWLLTGTVLSSKPITPDLKRINPVSGLQRIFSGETWFALLKSLLCAVVIGLTLAAWLKATLREVMVSLSPQDLLAVSSHLLLRQLGLGCLVLAVFAGMDYMFQRWSFMRKMRMDHKDLHDEFKQQEGSPEIKGERKQEHRRLVNDQ